MKLGQLCSFLLIGLGTAARGDSWEQLVAKVPPSANALVLIDVERTLASPLAEKEGWGKELELAYVSRPIFLPPEATKLVLAAQLQAEGGFQRTWELGVMTLSEPLSMRSIARSEGGYVEKINDTEVAWTPSDAYFVALDQLQLGVMFPADRQHVSRWIRFAKQNQRVRLSEYLSKALRTTGEKVQMLLAIDLTDVVQPHELDDHIRQSELFQQADLSSQKVVPLLTSLRGASLRVVVGNDAQAQLRIDFDQDVTLLKPIAHQLVLNVLTEHGATIGDLESWKTTVQGQSIRLQGPLSQDGLRRILSVVELPSTKFSLLKEKESGATEESSKESKMREASLIYFHSINTLFKDLKRDMRGNKAVAAVMERYARRIDRMPILNVDNDLLDYGSNVAQTLRAVALAKRQGGIQAGVRTAGMGGGDSGGNYYGGRGYGNYFYSFGFFGQQPDRYAAARRSAKERSSIKAQAMAQSKNARVEAAKAIEDATAQIRRQMTQKYGVEF